MSKSFPEHPYLQGNFAPVSFESDAHDLPIAGELPRELNGTLYRNGPNPQFAPRGFYHWFAGDGMLHAFHLENGKASYRNRFVRTPKFELEREAGQAMFGAFGNPMESDPSTFGKDSGIANTNVVWHAGRLIALEEAHKPFEVDPGSLEPRGYQDYASQQLSRMTAHPKIDPATGEMVCFAYGNDGPLTAGMAYYVIDKHGRLIRFDRFQAPYAAMVHDFLVTRDFVLFPIMPLTASMERAMSGKPAFAWEPDKGTHIGVLRRNAPIESLRWFKGDPRYVFHPMNAWNEGNKIMADVMEYPVAPLFPNPDGSMPQDARRTASLKRWTFDLDANSDGFTSAALDDLAGEFPRLDERHTGLAYRHGYFAAATGSDDSVGFDTLVHLDLKSGTRQMHKLGGGDAVSEPVFVPRSATAEEGDGWLLSVVWRDADKRSDLLVFDAPALAKGPIATVQLSTRVPFGFHGNWRPAAA
jgi:carotenoid cleavage dioxygenase